MGQGDTNGDSGRLLRFDDRRGADPAPADLGPRRSGRRFVIGAALALLALVGALTLGFRSWRAGQLERAAFGAAEVAPAVRPLAAVVPPGVDPAAWSDLVGRVEALLVRLTASGALTRPRMEALRAELRDRVAAATPGTAAVALGDLWSDLEDRAGPVLTADRPYRLAAALHPLARACPPDCSPADWSLTLLQARARLVDLARPGRLDPAARDALAAALSRRLARTTPATARADLAAVEAMLSSLGSDPRPSSDPGAPPRRTSSSSLTP